VAALGKHVRRIQRNLIFARRSPAFKRNSPALMPWRYAISNTSTMAHSTRARFGSACGLYCPILFIVTVYKGLLFVKQTPDGSRSACSGRFRSFTIASSNSGPSGSANRRCTKIANKRSQTKDLQFGSPHCAGTLRPCLLKSAHTLAPNYTLTICSWQDRPVEKSPSHY
jgi:hypothetical protein